MVDNTFALLNVAVGEPRAYSSTILAALQLPGVDVNIKGGGLNGTALFYFAKEGNWLAVHILCKPMYGVDLEKGGNRRTPLGAALSARYDPKRSKYLIDHEKCATELILAGANPNGQYQQGNQNIGPTPLECALKSSMPVKTIRQLMIAGANPSGVIQNNPLQTFLNFALEQDDAHQALCLIVSGAEIDEESRLYLAEISGYKPEELIEERKQILREHIRMLAPRVQEILSGLQERQISALELVYVLDLSVNLFEKLPLYLRWNMVKVVRHFHDRQAQLEEIESIAIRNN